MGRFLPPFVGKVRMGGTVKDKAKHLRANMTDTERLLWRHLRMRQLQGFKFRRQATIGPYIADLGKWGQRPILLPGIGGAWLMGSGLDF